MLGEAIERALAAGRALAQSTKQRQGFDAGFHPEGEDLGECGMYREAGDIVRELRHRGGADRADVERLVPHRAQDRHVPIVSPAVAADPDRELARLGAWRTAAHRSVEHLDP